MHKSIDDIYAPTGRDALFQRIKYIVLEVHRIQRTIEDDLIVFSNGCYHAAILAKNDIAEGQRDAGARSVLMPSMMSDFLAGMACCHS
jgi:hypothetical protein